MSDTTNQSEMTQKLTEAGKKAEVQQAEKRAKEVQGSHLLAPMTAMVTARGLSSEEKSGFLKVMAPGVKGKRVYLARKGGRVDLSGFSITNAAVIQVSETEAQEKHMGKVRGQLDFTKTDAEVMSAFEAALTELAVAPAEKKPAADASGTTTGVTTLAGPSGELPPAVDPAPASTTAEA